MVYIDDYNAPFRRMIMCHMGSPNLDELHAMAAAIGVARKWFQDKGRYPHYDICLSKKKIALRLGAVEVDARELMRLCYLHN